MSPLLEAGIQIMRTVLGIGFAASAIWVATAPLLRRVWSFLRRPGGLPEPMLATSSDTPAARDTSRAA